MAKMKPVSLLDRWATDEEAMSFEVLREEPKSFVGAMECVWQFSSLDALIGHLQDLVETIAGYDKGLSVQVSEELALIEKLDGDEALHDYRSDLRKRLTT